MQVKWDLRLQPDVRLPAETLRLGKKKSQYVGYVRRPEPLREK